MWKFLTTHYKNVIWSEMSFYNIVYVLCTSTGKHLDYFHFHLHLHYIHTLFQICKISCLLPGNYLVFANSAIKVGSSI